MVYKVLSPLGTKEETEKKLFKAKLNLRSLVFFTFFPTDLLSFVFMDDFILIFYVTIQYSTYIAGMRENRNKRNRRV